MEDSLSFEGGNGRVVSLGWERRAKQVFQVDPPVELAAHQVADSADSLRAVVGRVDVHPALLKDGFVTPLPPGLDPVAGAPLMCAGITAFNALRRAGATAGTRVAVIGLDGVGGLAVRYAVAMGARVAVIGRSRRGEDQANELGAELFIASSEAEPATALKAWDDGAEVILNAAPSTAAAAATIEGLAPDGTLVLCGYGSEPLTLPTQPMVLNRLHVMANPSGSPHDLRDTLAFSANHRILPEVVPIGLDEALGTLDAMAAGNSHGRSVIVF